jgi:cyclohexanone monooxygenase
MAKRPPLGHHYFEAFNKSNVQLVSIRENPIKEVTDKGITLEKRDARTNQDEYEFDVIIYAIGFDASTGPLSAIDVRGKDHTSLGELWKTQLQTFLAIAVTGFPNMFMISGPQCPFANFPVLIDITVDWIAQLMAYMEENSIERMEPKREAMEQYNKLLTDVYEMTVLPEAAKKAGSWYVGANIPGKRVTPLFWFGGVASYSNICNEEQNKGYPGLTFG